MLIEFMWFRFHTCPKGPVVRLTITKEWIMLTQGKPSTFTVTASNAEGDVVAIPSDIAVTASNGSASVGADGKGTVTPSSKGDETITVTGAGKTATATDTVQPDQTVDSLKVVFD
jgi:hypothetical protein